jgi:trehalose 6-phosphate phosphatase
MQSAQTACSTWLKQMDKPLVSRSRQTGIMVEDKKYSLSVHYRKAPAKKLARDEIASVISQLDPQPRVIWGKCVAILASPHGPHKGAALLEAMHRAGTNSAFYIGDDDSDEDVFTIPDARIMTVRVGRKESSAAQYYVARQSEVVQVVRAVLKNMRDNSIEMRA